MSNHDKNTFIRSGTFACECGKQYEKSQSFYAHQSHCKVHLGDRYRSKSRGYHTVYKNYQCVCGRVFNNSSSYIGHTSHCIVRLGEERYLENLNKSINACKIANEYSRSSHTLESRQKQSETRKRKYASGELSPVKGVGRGKYSYLVYKDKEILLRSTYEFIYALYLLYNNIEFEYESVRVQYKGHTYISDFKVDNRIIEIKGDYHADLSRQKEAFESLGFIYEVKFWDEIKDCYEMLSKTLPIDDILTKIKESHDSKNYYKYIWKNSLSFN